MPFDGRQPSAEVRVLDQALEVLGPKGEFWIQGENSDRRGNRCMLGAVNYARRKLGIKQDLTTIFIIRALCASNTCRDIPLYIESFNDHPGRTFDEVAGVLVHARNLAASQGV
jgi:hypothetical protein